jgi:hypothetical protein
MDSQTRQTPAFSSFFIAIFQEKYAQLTGATVEICPSPFPFSETKSQTAAIQLSFCPTTLRFQFVLCPNSPVRPPPPHSALPSMQCLQSPLCRRKQIHSLSLVAFP